MIELIRRVFHSDLPRIFRSIMHSIAARRRSPRRPTRNSWGSIHRNTGIKVQENTSFEYQRHGIGHQGRFDDPGTTC
jgi:hypothetical protein